MTNSGGGSMHKGGGGGRELKCTGTSGNYGKYPKVVGLKAPIAPPMVTNVGCK